MRNLKLILEYEGTNYCGWQKQSARNQTKKSIQETVEKALAKIVHKKIKLIASGRTDSGVHARGQVANFKSDTRIPLSNLKRALNSNLPLDIRVVKIEAVGKNFHSRFDARTKVYCYTIVNDGFLSPFMRRYAHRAGYRLDLAKMRQVASVLKGKHNFKSFQASDKIERSSVRTIKQLTISKDKNLIYITVEADGFLYNMVRNIAGTLIEVGRRKLSLQDFKRVFAAGNRKLAGPTAPAKGLSLLEVKY